MAHRPLAGKTRRAPLSNPSPIITSFSWGKLEIEGELRFKDARLWPGGGREWDWRETGTRHVPGVQPADVEEILEHGAEIIVLTRGVQEVLQIQPRTLDWLASQGVEVHVLQTERAVEIYNDLARRARVGGLFHSTC